MELQGLRQQGEVFRGFKDTSAYKMLKEWLDEKIGDTRNLWLTCELSQAETYRAKAMAYKEILTFIDNSVKMGDRATDMLNTLKRQEEERSNGPQG